MWKNSFLNYDNIFSAMQAFFIICTTVSWSELMYQAAYIRGPDLTPATDIVSPMAAVFFVLVIVIGNFFLFNQFVGVIISSYNREKEFVGKDFMLSEA